MEHNQQEVISIKEFAKRAGVSKQAIYSQLESRLQPYVVNLNNQKMIKIEALVSPTSAFLLLYVNLEPAVQKKQSNN